MAGDADLQLRGRLVPRLGLFRGMLPGSFVETRRSCGRPNCHCADGKSLHTQYQISVLIDGQPKTFHVPKSMVEQVRERIQLRQRFEAAAAAICKINLGRVFEREGKVIGFSRRHRLESYLDKVFNFSSQVEALPEGRSYPQHSGKKIFDVVFLGAACQFRSVHRLERECQRGGALSKRIGSLSEDALGYALERYDSQAVFRLGCQVSRQLKRNGVFRSKWSRGLVVAAVDGIEICNSFVRFCDHCMERKVTRAVGGEAREEIQYYHRICAVTVVSSAFPIPLGIRFQKKGENEVACSLDLLRELNEELGRRFVDVLVGEGLDLQAPFA